MAKDIDWSALELEYRAGVKSLRTVGAEFGISDAAIIKRAKRDGWTRDLKVRVRAATEAKLAASEVSEEVSKGRQVSEDVIVEAYANKQMRVIERQGERIDVLAVLSDKLTSELVHVTTNLELYEQLGEMMRAPDEKGKDRLNEIYTKTINSGSRISSFKALIESQKTLIGLQRQNVGLSDNGNGDSDRAPTIEEFSSQEIARRVAFVFARALHEKVE